MIALIDQQFKLAKSDSQTGKSMNINKNDSQEATNIPNLVNTYKSLK